MRDLKVLTSSQAQEFIYLCDLDLGPLRLCVRILLCVLQSSIDVNDIIVHTLLFSPCSTHPSVPPCIGKLLLNHSGPRGGRTWPTTAGWR